MDTKLAIASSVIPPSMSQPEVQVPIPVPAEVSPVQSSGERSNVPEPAPQEMNASSPIATSSISFPALLPVPQR